VRVRRWERLAARAVLGVLRRRTEGIERAVMLMKMRLVVFFHPVTWSLRRRVSGGSGLTCAADLAAL
jgi:hypothetical protein